MQRQLLWDLKVQNVTERCCGAGGVGEWWEGWWQSELSVSLDNRTRLPSWAIGVPYPINSLKFHALTHAEVFLSDCVHL